MVILKLISWSDEPERRRKDAGDIFLTASNYFFMGNEERLLLEHEDLIKAPDFETATAGAQLLGRDLTRLTLSTTRGILTSILHHELGLDEGSKLAMHMVHSERGRTFEEIRTMMDKLLQGLQD